jgi:hypothetical protein
MAMMRSPDVDPDVVQCSVVSQHASLGFLVDDKLSFVPQSKVLLASCQKSFNSLLNTLEGGGFPLPVFPSEVQSRITSKILCGAPVLILNPSFESDFNRLQNIWACSILGFRHAICIKHPLSVKYLGWPLRLGSHIIEDAITALARLRLLPADHPGHQMLLAAAVSSAKSWFQTVKGLMRKVSAEHQILEICDLQMFASQIPAAQEDADARKELLRAYRLHVVRPALLAYDALAYAKAARAILPSLLMPFGSLHQLQSQNILHLSDIWLGRHTWAWVKIWSVARCTGRWPLHCTGPGALPTTLEQCPHCSCPDADIRHALCSCPGTEQFAVQMREHGEPANRSQADSFLLLLFQLDSPPLIKTHHIKYVGLCLGNR